ncbi:DUF433 domain-containing protein [Thiotrichales bacterium HSG14]|nr:DUF433 domain-containing protein [Thiotrichales bacterium HSG14]
MLENATLQQNLPNQFQQLALLQQQLHFSEFLVQKQQQLKSACRHATESGKPCIHGLRITVYDVLEYLAYGMTIEEILEDFPELTQDDIRACLAFAADRERKLFVAPIMTDDRWQRIQPVLGTLLSKAQFINIYCSLMLRR